MLGIRPRTIVFAFGLLLILIAMQSMVSHFGYEVEVEERQLQELLKTPVEETGREPGGMEEFMEKVALLIIKNRMVIIWLIAAVFVLTAFERCVMTGRGDKSDGRSRVGAVFGALRVATCVFLGLWVLASVISGAFNTVAVQNTFLVLSVGGAICLVSALWNVSSVSGTWLTSVGFAFKGLGALLLVLLGHWIQLQTTKHNTLQARIEASSREQLAEKNRDHVKNLEDLARQEERREGLDKKTKELLEKLPELKETDARIHFLAYFQNFDPKEKYTAKVIETLHAIALIDSDDQQPVNKELDLEGEENDQQQRSNDQNLVKAARDVLLPSWQLEKASGDKMNYESDRVFWKLLAKHLKMIKSEATIPPQTLEQVWIDDTIECLDLYFQYGQMFVKTDKKTGNENDIANQQPKKSLREMVEDARLAVQNASPRKDKLLAEVKKMELPPNSVPKENAIVYLAHLSEVQFRNKVDNSQSDSDEEAIGRNILGALSAADPEVVETELGKLPDSTLEGLKGRIYMHRWRSMPFHGEEQNLLEKATIKVAKENEILVPGIKLLEKARMPEVTQVKYYRNASDLDAERKSEKIATLIKELLNSHFLDKNSEVQVIPLTPTEGDLRISRNLANKFEVWFSADTKWDTKKLNNYLNGEE